MRQVNFFVHGLPVPQGSKRAFKHPKTGNIIMVDQQKGLKSWRQDVAAVAAEHWEGEVSQGPIEIQAYFLFPRLKGHYNKHGLKKSAPLFKTTRPDLDKLVRSILDALTGIVYRDDSQVVALRATKTFGERTGVDVVVEEKMA